MRRFAGCRWWMRRGAWWACSRVNAYTLTLIPIPARPDPPAAGGGRGGAPGGHVYAQRRHPRRAALAPLIAAAGLHDVGCAARSSRCIAPAAWVRVAAAGRHDVGRAALELALHRACCMCGPTGPWDARRGGFLALMRCVETNDAWQLRCCMLALFGLLRRLRRAHGPPLRRQVQPHGVARGCEPE